MVIVYPRGFARHAFQGLSPRVRGNRALILGSLLISGSIPASAGEPRIEIWHTKQEAVYPRECGGTSPVLSAGMTLLGLSPRVRGNRRERYDGLR